MLPISSNIKLIRELSGKTQAEFGQKFDASKAMIISYEKGKAQPSFLFVDRLAKHAGVQAIRLMKETLKEDDIDKDKLEKLFKVENVYSGTSEDQPNVGNLQVIAGAELFKAITTLTESNKGLVVSNQAIVNTNQTIADTNAILAKKLVKDDPTDNSPSSIPIIDTSIWMDLQEVLAEIATGSGVYKSMAEARREIGIRLKLHVGGKQNPAGTQTDGGKKSIA